MDGKKILFICLGNICRSPIAEAVFNHQLQERGIKSKWEVDSAGIGSWHTGNLPERRARAVMKRHNIEMDHKARQIKKQDFDYFDVIFGMDDENMSDLKRMAPKGSKASLELFGSFDSQKKLLIRDPYYDDDDDVAGFETCYEQCARCSQGFLASLGQ